MCVGLSFRILKLFFVSLMTVPVLYVGSIGFDALWMKTQQHSGLVIG